jgi:DNA polymerase-3 subunit alpha (Gram-positive type)
MNDFLTDNISWDLLGDCEGRPENYRCGLYDAYIDSESRTLDLVIKSNFVVPPQDDRKLKAAANAAIPGFRAIKLEYRYDREHMAQDDNELSSMFVRRMIATASDPHIRDSIDPDSITSDGSSVIIKMIGRKMADRFNGKLASYLSTKLQTSFDISRKVVFDADEDGRKAVADKMQKIAEKARTEASTPDPSVKKRHAETSQPSDQGGSEGGGWNAGGGAGAGWSGKKRSSVKVPEEGDVFLGKSFKVQKITPISELSPDTGKVTVAGNIFHIENKPIKNDKQIVTILLTDKKNSTCLKTFLKNDQWEILAGRLHEGQYVVASGETEWSRFDNELNIMVKSIMKAEEPKRVDTWEGQRRVELHCHSKMSAMDGLNEVSRIVEQAAEWGQPAVALTDHGVVQGFPDAANTAKKLAKKGKNIKVLYGMEGYLYDDEGCIKPDGTIDYKQKPTNHIILLVKNQAGMKDLYKLVSFSHLDYFYRKPRLPRSVLDKYRENLILGSACEAGELYRGIENGLSDEELLKIASYYDYLEIQPIVNNEFLLRNGTYSSEEELRDNNRKIAELGEKLGKPVVATTDAHYDEPDSAIFRNIILKSMGFKDAENGHGLYLRTTNEMMDEFSYLGEEKAREVVIENTNKVAGWIDEGIKPVPDEKYPPKIEGAEETLRTTCEENARRIYGDPLPDRIRDRLETELGAIINNGYAVMYVSAQMLVKKSNEDGYLVGSRGSVGSSFAATMAGITEVNPLEPHYICPKCHYLEWGDMQKYDNGIDMPEKDCPKCGTPLKRDGFNIPFATFLGFNGNKEPDIDLNFAGEYQPRAHKYVGVIFGEKNVYKAGTVGTVAEKTAGAFVSNYFQDIGMPVNSYESMRLAEGCTGVKRTTGQHPGGIIIVPDDHEIYEFCPVQHPANDTKTDIVTTHFDYHKIDKNLLKLDILGHNVPSQIRQLQDMTGVDPMNVDLTDRKVLSIFNGIEALNIKDPDYRFTHGTYAIPEFGTSFTMQMLDDIKPQRFEDLVRMSGFSHGTDVWLNNAQDYIRSGVATMREVISTRDDIMNFLILNGIDNESSFRIMEEVRKKNLVLTEEHKQLMKEHGIKDWYIDSCSKIKYMFPRAHAVAYVMMSFRLAWYKVYYPEAFYAAYFTTVMDAFNSDVIMQGQKSVELHMDALAQKGNAASQKERDELTVLEVAYEMYARGYHFEEAELGKSKANKFWIDEGGVRLPYGAYSGVGGNAAKMIEEAYNDKPFDSVEDAMNRASLNKSAVSVLREHGVFNGLPETDQLCWAI